MLDSHYRPLCKVALPWRNRQMYMHSFDLADIAMAEGFEDYLLPVWSLCRHAGAVAGIAHMTIDEKIIQAGMSQRRPKPHVDGCFMPSKMIWGHEPGWSHYCDNIGGSSVHRMSVIVAASVAGCRVWHGTFDGAPKDDGDLSHISDQLGEGEILSANIGYLLSPDCVHELMTFAMPTRRTFLRIALPLS